MKLFINESEENYLETILIISQQVPVVRSIDIATVLDYSKASVSVAMKNLREKKYITVNKSGFITLTASGLAIAESIYERHTILASWLEHLGVDSALADRDACRMEHILSTDSFQAIKKHVTEHLI